MQEEFNPQAVKLVIGLGNQGARYAHTYHNIGHWFVDYLASGSSFSRTRSKTFVYVKKSQVFLVKTSVCMNDSGRAIMNALTFSHANPDQCIAVHDDADIALGGYQLAFGKRPAGHRGVQSIITVLHTNKFWRLRIGIREKHAPPHEEKRKRAGDFVLRPISKEHALVFERTFGEIRDRVFARE